MQKLSPIHHHTQENLGFVSPGVSGLSLQQTARTAELPTEDFLNRASDIGSGPA